jgi:predicted nuclease of predicted toxin-antitoxin system
LAAFLREQGFDVIHTCELPEGNETSDAEINRLSLSEKRIVISKDGDFYDSFSATKEPYKLLYIRTGNISNAKLIEVFKNNIVSIVREIEERDVVEMDQRYLIALH